jgi:hypothetical protein
MARAKSGCADAEHEVSKWTGGALAVWAAALDVPSTAARSAAKDLPGTFMATSGGWGIEAGLEFRKTLVEVVKDR